jgi:hypothetical protein
MLIALSFASPRRRCVSFRHKHLKGNDILRPGETPDILATILCNPAKRPHHPFWQIRGI